MNKRTTMDQIKRAQAGDMNARNAIIDNNMGLVHAIARKMGGIPYEDRVSEGVLGVVRAIEKFDCTLDIAFSTYAWIWVKSAIRRAIDNHSSLIRTPVSATERGLMVRRAQSELSHDLGRDPTADEIAALVGLTSKQVEDSTKAFATVDSLDRQVGDGDGDLGSTLGELVGELDPGIEAINQSGCLDEALETLSERQREAVERIYGFNGYEPTARKDVADILRVSRQRVYQIEADALAKLRTHPAITAFQD